MSESEDSESDCYMSSSSSEDDEYYEIRSIRRCTCFPKCPINCPSVPQSSVVKPPSPPPAPPPPPPPSAPVPSSPPPPFDPFPFKKCDDIPDQKEREDCKNECDKYGVESDMYKFCVKAISPSVPI